MRPISRAGIATACPSSTRSRRSWGRSARSSPRPNSARPAGNTPCSRWTASGGISGASACSATGIVRTSRWTPVSRPNRSAASPASSTTATSCGATSPCTGASTAGQRWPRPKSSTWTRPPPRSTPDSKWPTAESFTAGSKSARAAPCRFPSGPRRPGRCRPTRRSRSARTSLTCWWRRSLIRAWPCSSWRRGSPNRRSRAMAPGTPPPWRASRAGCSRAWCCATRSSTGKSP